MDHPSDLENGHQNTETLVSEIQDAEENEDQETIMLKIDTGAESIVVPQETECLSGDTISFVDDHLNRDVQTINTTDLAGFDNTQVVLHTLAGAVEQNAENTADSAVTGTFVADATTLQNLIATGAVQITDASGQPLQLVTLNTDQASIVPNVIDGTIPANSLTTTIQTLDSGTSVQANLIDPGETSEAENSLIAQLRGNTNLDIDQITRLSLLTGPPPIQDLPPGTPQWAARLRDCQKIGDFYRGWLASEVELDHVMTLHKQQTGTMWGTRQSPCPSKPATRLMWRSQYVPFDGMPFLNAGSRAIVMECQYGPRRKGSQSCRKDDMAPLKSDFKQTCPARIYIKKVKKFLEYQITVDNDKKTTKAAMDKAFTTLKEKDYEGIVQERYYVQLPTESAHEFHSPEGTPVEGIQSIEKPVIGAGDVPSRLHPYVADKIRELVSKGETRLYAIRKQLRKYVEKELFEYKDGVPDRHNLHYYPTVNDLQNHIHQAVKDIEAGVLGLSADAVNIELVGDASQLQGAIWQQLQERQQPEQTAHAESVTVTLTQEPGEGGHMVQKVETNLSDGSKQVSEKLTPETARLLSKLHPQFFSMLNQTPHVPIQIPESSSSHVTESLMASTNGIDTSGTTITVNIPHINEAAGSTDTSAAVLTLPQDTDGPYTMIQTDSGELILAKSLPSSATAASIVTNIGQGIYSVDTGETSTITDALSNNIDTDNAVLHVDTGVVNGEENSLSIQLEITNNDEHEINPVCVDIDDSGESSSKRIKLCLNEAGDEEELRLNQESHHSVELSDGNTLSISDHVEADVEAQRLAVIGNMCNIKTELEFSVIKNEDTS